ncbi:pyridoxal phosphate-dependent transferase [Lipomyces tetrasporus]|uniref:Pyridoxal phosphate-dependent transferase n=1 Tax=Lipomyces tetrasporus TaxID=54092 RepID=A0AAD7QSP5_9ASCO|nr:pyridoxal phosphate-dependent transferase [Lipomyces tetrasporus]KAJ8100593.1 pyridoxal phosphate-dependent transferase [Lipomyces tetrasporus]
MSLAVGRINLVRGWPAPDLLPVHHLSAAAQRVLSDPSIYEPALQYGDDLGYRPLREALSDWLSTHYNVSRDPDRICISGGASQNIACILQSFTDPAYTRAIWMVAPCYHLACTIFRDAGFEGRIRGFSEDEEGIDLVELEEGIKKVDEQQQAVTSPKLFKDAGQYHKFYRHVVYVVPTSANPSGKTMSLRRRKDLVTLARKYDALVICDDVYDFLQWPLHGSAENLERPEMRLPRLCDIDLGMGQAPEDTRGFGYAVSNGSFSKIAGPGIRTGWLEGSKAFSFGLSQTGSTMSGGSPSQFCASILAELLQTGNLQTHLSKIIRPTLQRRHRLLMEAFHERLAPLGVECRESSLPNGTSYGGYFVWLTLPKDMPSRLVAEVALHKENLIVGNGAMFEVHGNNNGKHHNFNRHIRLTFAYVSEDELVEGVQRLRNVIQRIRHKPQQYVDQKLGLPDNLLETSK